tara:strand:- start:9454 stop:9906 length:453 start_codon:yes stop_codon:yes gene_type:complete
MKELIKEVSAKECFPVRHAVLRKGRPLSSCAFEDDQNEYCFHLGLFVKSEIVAIASFIPKKFPEQKTVQPSYQLRGMAVLESHQGRGLGVKLLDYGLDLLKGKEASILWMNARIGAVEFYQKLQFSSIGDLFDIPPIGIHQRMYKVLQNE